MEVNTTAGQRVEQEEAQVIVQAGALEEHPAVAQGERAKEPEGQQAGQSTVAGVEKQSEPTAQQVEESATASFEERLNRVVQQVEESPAAGIEDRVEAADGGVPAAAGSGAVRELRIVPYQAPLWAGNLVPHFVPGSETGAAVFEEMADADVWADAQKREVASAIVNSHFRSVGLGPIDPTDVGIDERRRVEARALAREAYTEWGQPTDPTPLAERAVLQRGAADT